MPLVGGGGTGNVAGSSNPSGTGQSLNYIGDHAYLYTGFTSVNNVETIIARFSTGNLYIVGTFQPQMDRSGGSDNYRFRVKINNEIVISCQTTSAQDYTPYEEIEILIPSNSVIEITAENVTDTDANDIGSIIIGRVYA